MRRRLDLDRYADALLLALFDGIVLGQDKRVTRNSLKAFLPAQTENLSRLCLERLRNRGDVSLETVIERQIDPRDLGSFINVENEYIYVTEHGFDRVNSWTDDEHTVVNNISAGGERQGNTVTIPLYGNIGGGDVPASDRQVTLDHNHFNYHETIAALDMVIKEVGNDRLFDNEWGAEKKALLNTLVAGRELLNASMLDVRVGIMLIVEPLQLLAVKYEQSIAQAVVGSVITTAIAAVMKLFGLES